MRNRLVLSIVAICILAALAFLEKRRPPQLQKIIASAASEPVMADGEAIVHSTNSSSSKPIERVKMGVTNHSVLLTNQLMAVGPDGEELLKTIVDPVTGNYVATGQDRRAISLKDKFGNVIWKSTIVVHLQDVPKWSSANEINVIDMVHNRLWVGVGIHDWYTVDIKTGQVNFEGSD